MDRQPPSSPPPWYDLANNFAAIALRSAEGQADWLAIWRVLLEDAWFRAEIGTHAFTIILSKQLPGHWLEDVEHDAMLILARELRKAADLYVDPKRLDEFGAWLGTIIDNACLEAVRTPRRRRSKRRKLQQAEEVIDPNSLEHHYVDLPAAIAKLNEPTRSIMGLYKEGFRLVKIAEMLALPYETVRREKRKGVRQLREDLMSGS